MADVLREILEDDSSEDFEGFKLEDVEKAEDKYVYHLLNLDDALEKGSDLEVSDIESESDPESETESSDDDEIALADYNRWTDNIRDINIPAFRGPQPGPTQILETDKKELDFLNLLFPDEYYTTVSEETNSYAQLCMRAKPNPRWYDTTPDEMRAFLGCMVVMGIVSAPAQDLYWSKDKLFHLSCIEERFTRTRFENIQRYFHLANTMENPPRNQPGHDRLVHVRKLMEGIRENFKAQYHPHKEVSIDEAMVGFSGRLGFKQYVPLKPTKRGIKVWVRADPYNGYMNDFQVYTGKENNVAEANLGGRVVMDLMRPILNLGHHVYCDSFFTSPDLFLKLWDMRTAACGTVKQNRKGMPKNLDKVKLKKQGDHIMRQKANLVVSVWRDKRNLTILSTNTNQSHQEVLRKQKDGTVKNVTCPNSVKLYNSYMNGVDHADQLRSTYNIARKSLKWWKYLFLFLYDVCIVNAYILMRESPNHALKTKNNRSRTRTQLEFRMKLAHQLIGNFSIKRKRKPEFIVSQAMEHHWPSTMPKKRKCRQCTKSGVRREPLSGCTQCNVNLCSDCFKPYHLENFPNIYGQ